MYGICSGLRYKVMRLTVRREDLYVNVFRICSITTRQGFPSLTNVCRDGAKVSADVMWACWNEN